MSEKEIMWTLVTALLLLGLVYGLTAEWGMKQESPVYAIIFGAGATGFFLGKSDANGRHSMFNFSSYFSALFAFFFTGWMGMMLPIPLISAGWFAGRLVRGFFTRGFFQ
jgi:hypothetical protein